MTLGLTPAIVFESLTSIMKHLLRNYRNTEINTYIIYTKESEHLYEIIKETLEKLKINVYGVPLSISDIRNSRDNTQFSTEFKRILKAASKHNQQIIISIAGGRKTMSAMATYIAMTHPEKNVRERTSLLMHVIVPSEIEFCSMCRLRVEQHEKLVEKYGMDNVVDAIVNRIHYLLKDDNGACKKNPCPGSTVNTPEDLAYCYIPCVPNPLEEVVLIPGPSLTKDEEALYSIVAYVYEKVREKLGDKLGYKYDEKRAKEYIKLLTGLSDKESVIDILDNMEPVSLPCRRRGIRVEYHGFRESDHHARRCGIIRDLDAKLETMFNKPREPACYVWKIRAISINPSAGVPECGRKVYDRRREEGSFKMSVKIKCTNDTLTELELFLTALTRRQAEVMAQEIAEMFREEGLCR
ncbi:MAG: CRISPR-associated ring nuclease [Desulfurococcales archaeon]|nr:CRISPR-associated ring nuclease [Desulfurococcales archaeon]